MSTLEGGPDRRRSARVDLLAELQGHVVTLDERIQVRQVSDHGLTLETTAPLSPRVVHDFRLAVGDRTALVKGRVLHSRVHLQGDTATYVSGVEFVEPSAEARALLATILVMARGDAPAGDTI